MAGLPTVISPTDWLDDNFIVIEHSCFFRHFRAAFGKQSGSRRERRDENSLDY